MDSNIDNNMPPLLAFLLALPQKSQDATDSDQIAPDNEQEMAEREAKKIWLAAMNDASVVYAKRRGETFRRDMQEFVNAYRSGNSDQLPALSPMAVLQSEIIVTVAVMLADFEGMIHNAGVQGDTEAVVRLTQTYIGLQRASAAFSRVPIA